MPSADDSKVAKPKKLRKPQISVTVVKIMEEEVAGSCPMALSAIGITAPAKPAMIIDNIIEIPITMAIPEEDAQK